jgi:hypothetical protein
MPYKVFTFNIVRLFLNGCRYRIFERLLEMIRTKNSISIPMTGQFEILIYTPTINLVGMLMQAEDILQAMRINSIEPTLKSYKLMIVAYSKSDDVLYYKPNKEHSITII